MNLFSLSLVVLVLCASSLSAETPSLRVSDDRRSLVTTDGKPFFWLGDTAWELFHRLNREEAEHYLKTRSAQRFTVIQAVVLAELDGLTDPNPYGHTPLKDNDPTMPNEDYFAHVDWVIGKANELGLLVGLLPTWGDKVGPKKWGKGPEIFTPENARIYGEWLGKRYRERGIVWILGGDRNPEKPEQIAVWNALAEGLRRAIGTKQLITFHPQGGATSSTWFHDAPWLDFNMQQNGHNVASPVWERLAKDRERKPTKPVLDGEPLYEDHPLNFKAKEFGYSNAADIRRYAYSDTLSGAFGHTYGHHSVWQCFDATKRAPVNGPLMGWREAIERPGAKQMRYVRALLESRPLLTRVPDPSLIVGDPSAGTKRVIAARDHDGRYAFVYLPESRTVMIDLTKLSGKSVQAWWYDPRTGEAHRLGTYPTEKPQSFTPTTDGENLDWVLVLDDVARKFPPPGTPLP